VQPGMRGVSWAAVARGSAARAARRVGWVTGAFAHDTTVPDFVFDLAFAVVVRSALKERIVAGDLRMVTRGRWRQRPGLSL
jgi:hypothetical protein